MQVPTINVAPRRPVARDLHTRQGRTWSLSSIAPPCASGGATSSSPGALSSAAACRRKRAARPPLPASSVSKDDVKISLRLASSRAHDRCWVLVAFSAPSSPAWAASRFRSRRATVSSSSHGSVAPSCASGGATSSSRGSLSSAAACRRKRAMLRPPSPASSLSNDDDVKISLRLALSRVHVRCWVLIAFSAPSPPAWAASRFRSRRTTVSSSCALVRVN
jgi:hypothetical protein